MRLVLPLAEVTEADRPLVGEKSFNLSRLLRGGFAVPPTLCVSSGAYDRHVDSTGLRERIQIELNRRDLDGMRWEELWDAALRIRGMFLQTPIARDMASEILDAVEGHIGTGRVAVRSSSPGEDSAQRSFAGLHESFVNIGGREEILDRLLMVWASLWSDGALLYRRELGLDLEKSTMAAAVQAFVEGESSGVVFTVSPSDRTRIAVEAAHGLNEGLVDGTVEPDRWSLDRESRRILEHRRSESTQYLKAGGQGTVLAELPSGRDGKPPLEEGDVAAVAEAALGAEKLFGAPQDVEWTMAGGRILILQSRPITTLSDSGEDDARGWYLSLRRSFENLKALRVKLERELVPAMRRQASAFAESDTAALTNLELAAEIRRRAATLREWENLYREHFIPFAHGMRLFGMVYNRAVRPEDPYEFVDLLSAGNLESLERNRALQAMAERIRGRRELAEAVERDDEEAMDRAYLEEREAFIRRFGDLSCGASGAADCGEESRVLDLLLLEMARQPPGEAKVRRETGPLVEAFLDAYPGGDRQEAEELLDLARASYSLRDNDNIYLGRIEAGVIAASTEGSGRVTRDGSESPADGDYGSVADALEGSSRPAARQDPGGKATGTPGGDRRERDRQLVGQPAGPGLASGRARVIRHHGDLSGFRHGEVLVCDAVDPNMTFFAPLAAAVIERRGGMLIHGAIIAREYGLPCVTGIPGATEVIRTGDEVTVDGFLGIVTLEEPR